MSDQPQRPTTDDRDARRAYWQAQGMPWRTEPEVDAERQLMLAERRAVTADWRKGAYPFCGLTLDRADVEWLLATHDEGRGPVDWSDEKQREREGLDLRGANLDHVDLSRLPLARLRGGLVREEWDQATVDQRNASRLHLEGATLVGSHLEGAFLDGAHMEDTTLFDAHLEQAVVGSAHLEGALLRGAHLEGARIRGTFFNAGTNLSAVHLFSQADGPAFIGEVRWGGVNVTAVDWRQLTLLREEWVAQQRKTPEGKVKPSARRIEEYEEAVRAYRQLAIVLRGQGVNDDADRFAYRAQVLQRSVARLRGQVPPYAGSGLLDLVAGYGHRPSRSLLAYGLVVAAFAGAYFSVTNFAVTPFLPTHSRPLAWYEALVLSISSFHGRGFFPFALALGDPIAILAAGEAIIGLLIEIVFIATFTQRFFAR